MAIAIGPFQGDSAYMGRKNILDWSEDPVEAIERVLTAAADCQDGDYIEVDSGAEAVVAAELVAGLHGRPFDDMPPEARAWLEMPPDIADKRRERLRRLSIRATEVVVTSPNSEFRELLEGGRQGEPADDLIAWVDFNRDLLVRLGMAEEKAQAVADRALEPLPPVDER